MSAGRSSALVLTAACPRAHFGHLCCSSPRLASPSYVHVAPTMDAVPSARYLTYLRSQCGPTCSQNVAYNQPFISSWGPWSSNIVPECFLHRPDLPFLQKTYTEDKKRDLAALNLWRFCRLSDIEDWAWLADAQTPTADPPAGMRSGSAIIDKSRQVTRPESDSGRMRASLTPCQEDISTELPPKNKLRLVVFSETRGQTSARARANAKTVPRTSSQGTSSARTRGAKRSPVGKKNRNMGQRRASHGLCSQADETS